MKTTITITVDSEVKIKAMPIIQNKLNRSLSSMVNDFLLEIIQKNEVYNGSTSK